MRLRSVWKMLFGIERTVIEGVRVELETVVLSVRPRSREKQRCGACGRRCPREDSGEGRRRWRALDLGTTFAYLEADAPRVYCKAHRVVVAAVPWARHDSRFTIAFEDQCCWLAVNTSKKAVAELMRVTWRTVGSICKRVADEGISSQVRPSSTRAAGLRAMPAPLLEEERDASRRRSGRAGRGSTRLDRPVPGARLAAGDQPVDAVEVEALRAARAAARRR